MSPDRRAVTPPMPIPTDTSKPEVSSDRPIIDQEMKAGISVEKDDPTADEDISIALALLKLGKGFDR